MTPSNRPSTILILLSLVAPIFALPQIPPAVVRSNDDFEIIILHNNDMHARFEQTNKWSSECSPADAGQNHCYGGFARVAHVIRDFRTKEKNGGTPVLYLNAGDTYTGTPWFTLYKYNITAEFLNVLRPDAISLGNHEFDDGVDGLVPFLNKVDFPVLAANLDLSKTPTMKTTKSLVPSVVFEKAGIKIGVVGYLTPETKKLVMPNNVEFLNEIPAINAEATKLKAQGVHIIIALGHSGLERDKEIAAACPDVDFVIGGHSHSFLFNGNMPDIDHPVGPYPVLVSQKSGKVVPVVQSYAYTKYLGQLKLTFDKDGNLLHWDGQPMLLNGSVLRDEDVLTLLKKYQPGITALQNEIVGRSKVLLDSGNCRLTECNVGNLIADSMLYAYAKRHTADNYWTDAPVALIQGGGIRASFAVRGTNGEMSKAALTAILPFNNPLWTVQVTGKELKEVFEHSVYRYDGESGWGEFLQVAGVHVTYDMEQRSGERVIHLEVLCSACDIPIYRPVTDIQTIKLVITDFLGMGGDGYSVFEGKPHNVIGILDIVAAEEYIRQRSPIYPKVEWRIQLENLDKIGKDAAVSLKVSIHLLTVTAVISYIMKSLLH